MKADPGYFYLASPYSKYTAGMEAAYIDVCKQAALLLRSGVPVLSPIAATHGVAIYGDLDPKDHDIWLPLDWHFMDVAHGLIVCMMDGWEQSIGVTHEIDYFKRAGKPIVYMKPGEVPGCLVSSA